MSDVFISYAREDLAFVTSLCEELRARDIDVWVDLEGIYVGEEFWPRICAGIEQADAICFVMTPNSLASAYAQREVEHAVQHNKRILPIKMEFPQACPIPHALEARQWFLVDRAVELPAKIDGLVEAIRTDAVWVRMHTRLLGRAIEWNTARRDAAFMLRGPDLEAAEKWLAGGIGHQPAPTTLHAQFINASRKETTRRQRMTITALVIALLVTAGLGTAALIQYRNAEDGRLEAERQRNEADQQRSEAEKQRAAAEQKTRHAAALQLAAQAKEVQQRSSQLAILLGAEAVRATSAWSEPRAPAAEQALRNVLAQHGGTALRAHTEDNWLVEVSPDGRWALTGGRDPVAFLYDLQRMPSPPRELRHPVWVTAAKFSPDAHWLATGSWGDNARDNEVWLWDLTSSDPVGSGRVLRGHESRVSSFDISADSSLAATASWDGFVRVWNLRAPDPSAAPVSLPQPEATSVAFSPDGSRIVSAGRGSLRSWRLKPLDPTLFRSVEIEAGGHSGLQFTPDGRRLIAAGTGKPSLLWNLASEAGQAPVTLTRDGTSQSLISSNGRWSLFTGEYDSFYVTDLSSSRPERTTQIKKDSIGEVEAGLSRDGRWAVTYGSGVHPIPSMYGPSSEREQDDHDALLWPLYTARPFTAPVRLIHESTVVRAVFSPDGQWLVTGTDSGWLHRWNLRTQALRLEFGDARELSGAEIVDLVLAKGPKAQALLQQFESPDHDAIPGTGRIWSMAFTPDSRLLLVAPRVEPVRFFDFSRQGLAASPLALLSPHTATHTPRVSPSGRWLAISSIDGTLSILDLECKDPSACASPVTAQQSLVKAMTLGDRHVVTGADDNSIWVTELSEGKARGPALVLNDATGPISELELSLDERWLAVTSRGPEAGQADSPRLYDLRSQSPERPILLRGHTGHVHHIVFSPDSRRLVSTSADKTARIWDLTASAPGARPEVIESSTEVVAAVFSRDGSRLALSGQSFQGQPDAHARVLSWSSPDEPARQCELPTTTHHHLLTLSSDGRQLITVDDDNTTALWAPDFSPGPPHRIPLRQAGGEQNFDVLLSADDRWFLSFGHEAEASLWDLGARQAELTRRSLRTNTGHFWAAAFSPDSHWLIAGTSEGEIRIWDLTVPDPEQSSVILSTPGGIEDIVVTPNSRWFITSGSQPVAWHLGMDRLLDLAAQTAGRSLNPDERQLYGVPSASPPGLPAH